MYLDRCVYLFADLFTRRVYSLLNARDKRVTRVRKRSKIENDFFGEMGRAEAPLISTFEIVRLCSITRVHRSRILSSRVFE